MVRSFLFLVFLVSEILTLSGCGIFQKNSAPATSRDAQADLTMSETKPPATVNQLKEKLEESQPGFPQQTQKAQAT